MTGPKVLLVDDDQDLIRLVGAQLKPMGFQVVGAGDGVTAVMMAQRHKPDVIVLDIGLPGADGFKVMKRLRTLVPLSLTPIIILTGRALTPAEEQHLKSEAHTLLRKPVDMAALQAAIGQALGGNPGPETFRGHHP